MGKAGQIIHLYRRRSPFEGMGSTDLVHRLLVRGVVLEDQNILLENLYLHVGFHEEILQKLFVIWIKVVAHLGINLYIYIALSQARF